ncbi:MAG: phosphodiester glycosidase family protein [Bacillota bacterium]
MFSYILIMLLLSASMLLFTPARAGAEFGQQLEHFIREGKQLRLLVDKDMEKIILSPVQELKLYDWQQQTSPLTLSKDRVYQIRPVTGEKTRQVYTIQVFVTSSRDKALDLKYRLTGNGYNPVNVKKDDDMYKVNVGKFEAKSQAEATAVQLAEDGWHTWVRETGIDDETASAGSPGKPGIYQNGKYLDFSSGYMIVDGNFTLKNRNGDYQLPGKSEVIASESGLQLINQASLEEIIPAALVTLAPGFVDGLADQESVTLEQRLLLEAMTVVIRTHLLAAWFDRRHSYLSLEYYRGLPLSGLASDKIKLIHEAAESTEGQLVTGEQGLPRPAFVSQAVLGELALKPLTRLLNNGARGLSKKNVRQVLKEVLQGYKFRDLTGERLVESSYQAPITSGLVFEEIRELSWWGPRVITLVKMDLGRNRFNLKPFLARDQISGLEPLSQAVKTRGALTGVNGGYFKYDGSPLGLLVIDGQLVSEPLYNRTALIITDNGEISIDRLDWRGFIVKKTGESRLEVDGVNRQPDTGEIVVLNSFYGPATPQTEGELREIVVKDSRVISNTVTSGNTQIPKNGFVIQAREVNKGLSRLVIGQGLEFKNQYPGLKTRGELLHALGGGPGLLTDGEIAISGREEQFQDDILRGRAPRTAVGLIPGQQLILLTVDGRQPGLSQGMTLEEIAEYLKQQGAQQAMNLDGGGSSRMVVRGFTMNNPSADRRLATGLLIMTAGK